MRVEGQKNRVLTRWIWSGKVAQVAPEAWPKGQAAVCVRFLRTQQRAESQCRKMHYPRAWASDDCLPGAFLEGFWWVVVCCLCSDSFEIFTDDKPVIGFVSDSKDRFSDCRLTGFPGLSYFSTESLILAQDERWRRA